MFRGLEKKSSLRGLLIHHKKTNTQKQGGCLMVKHASLFSQLIALIDRKKFHELVYRHNSERFAKKFNSWENSFMSFLISLRQVPVLQEQRRCKASSPSI